MGVFGLNEVVLTLIATSLHSARFIVMLPHQFRPLDCDVPHPYFHLHPYVHLHRHAHFIVMSLHAVGLGPPGDVRKGAMI